MANKDEVQDYTEEFRKEGLPVNKIILVVAAVLSILSLLAGNLLGLIVFGIIVVAIISATLKDNSLKPKFGEDESIGGLKSVLRALSLQQDGRDNADVDFYNRTIDVLAMGGIITETTTPDEIQIEIVESEDRFVVFLFSINKIGIAPDDIQKALEKGKAYLNIAEVGKPERINNRDYTIRCRYQTENELLRDNSVGYKDLDFSNLSLNWLPVGKFEDGSDIAISVKSQNGMICGNPGSGKSVLLHCLLLDLYRLNVLAGERAERIIVYTAKPTDFRHYAGRIEIVDKVPDLIALCQQLLREEKPRRDKLITQYDVDDVYKIPGFPNKELPHITLIIDEYAEMRKTTFTPKKINKKTGEVERGKEQKLGLDAEDEIKSLVAVCRYIGISVFICSQRLDQNSIDTSLRGNISGNLFQFRSDFASAKFIWGDEQAKTLAPLVVSIPAGSAGGAGIGVGQGSGAIEGRLFKGAFPNEQDRKDVLSLKFRGSDVEQKFTAPQSQQASPDEDPEME